MAPGVPAVATSPARYDCRPAIRDWRRTRPKPCRWRRASTSSATAKGGCSSSARRSRCANGSPPILRRMPTALHLRRPGPARPWPSTIRLSTASSTPCCWRPSACARCTRPTGRAARDAAARCCASSAASSCASSRATPSTPVGPFTSGRTVRRTSSATRYRRCAGCSRSAPAAGASRHAGRRCAFPANAWHSTSARRPAPSW